MKPKQNAFPHGVVANSLRVFAVAFVGVWPLIYLSYCARFDIQPNLVLNSIFSNVIPGAVILVGLFTLGAWLVGAWRGKPERVLDALRSVMIGCLIAFWILMSYYLRK